MVLGELQLTIHGLTQLTFQLRDLFYRPLVDPRGPQKCAPLGVQIL